MLSGATLRSHYLVGEGIDMRFEERGLSGFPLVHREQVPHMAAFVEPSLAL
jgi:hypothetical protein